MYRRIGRHGNRSFDLNTTSFEPLIELSAELRIVVPLQVFRCEIHVFCHHQEVSRPVSRLNSWENDCRPVRQAIRSAGYRNQKIARETTASNTVGHHFLADRGSTQLVKIHCSFCSLSLCLIPVGTRIGSLEHCQAPVFQAF